jgi:hypothetical protein
MFERFDAKAHLAADNVVKTGILWWRAPERERAPRIQISMKWRSFGTNLPDEFPRLLT